jgi:hypothetical protein
VLGYIFQCHSNGGSISLYEDLARAVCFRGLLESA